MPRGTDAAAALPGRPLPHGCPRGTPLTIVRPSCCYAAPPAPERISRRQPPKLPRSSRHSAARQPAAGRAPGHSLLPRQARPSPPRSVPAGRPLQTWIGGEVGAASLAPEGDPGQPSPLLPPAGRGRGAPLRPGSLPEEGATGVEAGLPWVQLGRRVAEAARPEIDLRRLAEMDAGGAGLEQQTQACTQGRLSRPPSFSNTQKLMARKKGCSGLQGAPGLKLSSATSRELLAANE